MAQNDEKIPHLFFKQVYGNIEARKGIIGGKRDCLGHSYILYFPKILFSTKAYPFQTFRVALKTHIFHVVFPDSYCLFPIILITLITLKKVSIGLIHVYVDSLQAKIMLKAFRGLEFVFSLINTYTIHSSDILISELDIYWKYVPILDCKLQLFIAKEILMIYVNKFVFAKLCN